MRLPIDTVAVQFMSAGPAEPVLDFETRAPKLDANGLAVYSVHLFAISPDSYDTLSVKVAGEPKGVGNFTPVKVTNLIASTWDIEVTRQGKTSSSSSGDVESIEIHNLVPGSHKVAHELLL